MRSFPRKLLSRHFRPADTLSPPAEVLSRQALRSRLLRLLATPPAPGFVSSTNSDEFARTPTQGPRPMRISSFIDRLKLISRQTFVAAVVVTAATLAIQTPVAAADSTTPPAPPAAAPRQPVAAARPGPSKEGQSKEGQPNDAEYRLAYKFRV